MVSAVVGVAVAFATSIPPGPLVVVAGVVLFAGSWAARVLL